MESGEKGKLNKINVLENAEAASLDSTKDKENLKEKHLIF